MAYPRKRIGLLAAVGAVAAVVGGDAARAYLIVWPAIHEAITRAARQCIRDAGEERPGNCGTRHRDIRKNAYLDPGQGYTREEKATRWSDDPVSAIGSLGMAKYGSQLKLECPRITMPTSRLDEVGLTCSSHFGRLQFMHAQAARMPDGTPESDALTRRKMISWARFAYRVATEDPGLPLDADYCETVSKLGEIGSDLAPDGLLYCRKGGKGPWRVASLFNVKCGGIKHIFKWRDCPDRRGPKSKGRAVRFAQGAILHMVQDSYSQSHVYRGTGTPPPANGTFAPRIVCAPARHFYEYNEQDSDGHSAADALPALDSTCKPGAKIDDVITATAKIIWHIEQKRPEDEFIQYLETSVLG